MLAIDTSQEKISSNLCFATSKDYELNQFAPLTLTTLSTKASLAAHAQMLLDTNPGPINT
jgi:hypothetical protein